MSAFNLVDHHTLLGKLSVYGTSTHTCSWFQTNLVNRSLRIQIVASKSRQVALGPYGVSQGSVLCIIFVIPAATPKHESKVQQTTAYVDDLNEQVANKSLAELMGKLQIRAGNVTDWLFDNRMVIAKTKIKLIVTSVNQLRSARTAIVNFCVTVGDFTIHASTVRDYEA